MRSIIGINLILLVTLFITCTERKTISINEADVAAAWAHLTLDITRNTPANSPTYASRCFGYIGLTMYESVVHGYSEYNSIIPQLNDPPEMPLPEEDKTYHWVISMNAAQAEILRRLYIQTSDANKYKIDSLEKCVQDYYRSAVDAETMIRSVAYGRAVADKIFAWSTTDGGHRGYLANFDKNLITPSHAGCWEPPLYGQSFSHFPLHPYWGKNRTFVVDNQLLPTPVLMAYDTLERSEYAALFNDVYDKSTNLSQTEKEIALWWGDDPGQTFTPPGHSYYIGSIVLKKANSDLITCAETYARVGLSVADAFIDCWKWKYHYYSERPSSFITKRIDNHWESFWPDPPFPAFPSGHATQAAAVATVLESLFGKSFEFTDDAHVNREPDEFRGVEFRSRHFTSFWQVAEETAMSRFYGGIHTKYDNDVGLREGRKIGENVNNLQWRKDRPLANLK